jgi:hypothetical protein
MFSSHKHLEWDETDPRFGILKAEEGMVPVVLANHLQIIGSICFEIRKKIEVIHVAAICL